MDRIDPRIAARALLKAEIKLLKLAEPHMMLGRLVPPMPVFSLKDRVLFFLRLKKRPLPPEIEKIHGNDKITFRRYKPFLTTKEEVECPECKTKFTP